MPYKAEKSSVVSLSHPLTAYFTLPFRAYSLFCASSFFIFCHPFCHVFFSLTHLLACPLRSFLWITLSEYAVHDGWLQCKWSVSCCRNPSEGNSFSSHFTPALTSWCLRTHTHTHTSYITLTLMSCSMPVGWHSVWMWWNLALGTFII